MARSFLQFIVGLCGLVLWGRAAVADGSYSAVIESRKSAIENYVTINIAPNVPADSGEVASPVTLIGGQWESHGNQGQGVLLTEYGLYGAGPYPTANVHSTWGRLHSGRGVVCGMLYNGCNTYSFQSITQSKKARVTQVMEFDDVIFTDEGFGNPPPNSTAINLSVMLVKPVDTTSYDSDPDPDCLPNEFNTNALDVTAELGGFSDTVVLSDGHNGVVQLQFDGPIVYDMPQILKVTVTGVLKSMNGANGPSTTCPGPRWAFVQIGYNVALNATAIFDVPAGIGVNSTQAQIVNNTWQPVITDCNHNGIGDECEVALGIAADENADGVPDECECPADLTGTGNMPDGNVDVSDLFRLLANWNTNGQGADLAPPNDVVNVSDLFALLAAWGACD